MNNNIFILIILFTFLVACDEKDPEEFLTSNSEVCNEMVQNPSWITEDFKNKYSIQFPDNYEGVGKTGFEGNTFRKMRIDEKVLFVYNYCSNTYCYDFGNPLPEPFPNSIKAKDSSGKEIVLEIKKEFCIDGELEGVLFYNSIEKASATFYLKSESEFLEGLTVYFIYDELQEVEGIVRTISKARD